MTPNLDAHASHLLDTLAKRRGPAKRARIIRQLADVAPHCSDKMKARLADPCTLPMPVLLPHTLARVTNWSS